MCSKPHALLMDLARLTGMQPGSSYVWIGEEEDIARPLDAGGKLGTDEASRLAVED